MQQLLAGPMIEMAKTSCKCELRMWLQTRVCCMCVVSMVEITSLEALGASNILLLLKVCIIRIPIISL